MPFGCSVQPFEPKKMHRKRLSSALNETDIRFVSTLKEFPNALYHFPSTPSWDVLMRLCGALWDTLQAKVSVLCSFLKRATIMRSARSHQAEEDRSTLQMHTSLLSFQCNNTCQGWWGGSRDGLVWAKQIHTQMFLHVDTRLHTCTQNN